MTYVSRKLGLTLVEVLIALVVMALVFLALAATQALTARMTRTSQQSAQATELAVKYIGNLSVTVLESFDEYRLDCTTSVTDPKCQGTASLGDGYVVDWNVIRGEGYELSGLMRIDVAISGTASASMSTFVSCMDFTYTGAIPRDEANNPQTRTPTINSPGVCKPS